MGRGGRGTKLYDREKAWPSIYNPLGGFTRCGSVESVEAAADDGMKA